MLTTGAAPLSADIINKALREFNIEATQGGAFGLATATTVGVPLVFNFAAVDDITNSVLVHSLPVP